AGGTINADLKGYQHSTGPGEGIDGNGQCAGGAAYGGDGGVGNVGAGGSAYGSITAPTDLGSGGGDRGGGYSTYGGAGGGAVKLTISGTSTISGVITANGGNGSTYSGGGSGGSVYITTGILAGAGTIITSGGIGNSSAGGGGGGRIAVHYTTDSSSVTYQAYGGSPVSRQGGAGTIYTKDTDVANGDLLIDNNSQDSLSDTYLGRTPINETITFDAITIQNYGNLETGTSVNITYTALDWSTKGTITDLGGTFDLLSGGGAMTIPETSRLYAYTTRTNSSCTVNGYMETRQAITTAGDFNVGISGILTHEANTTTQQYVIDITAANFTIAAGGTINAD
ncbi:MAG: hypothetical protein KAS59_07115, partial [Alphaproteobacteria bacterium]|nr:hypothetical protein [Alphaproteobacteria bacterium]